MTRFWLIRHGQTDWNVEGRWQGQAPHAPGLNANGLAQAQIIAADLVQQAAAQGLTFAALYSSDLLRARQTAQVIAQRLGVPVSLDARLREVNLGLWEGMFGEDVARQYPTEMEERARNPAHARPPEGETVIELAERISQALSDIAHAHPQRDVIIVSHGLAIAAALCLADEQSLMQVFERVPENAAAHVLSWRASLSVSPASQ